jgi:hypothetical protein
MSQAGLERLGTFSWVDTGLISAAALRDWVSPHLPALGSRFFVKQEEDSHLTELPCLERA